MTCMRFLVSGRVQGVFFRASARQQAQALGLRGHARNLTDGRVEVLAWGEQAELASLHKWLHQGPPAARVDQVVCQNVTDGGPPPPDFTTD